MSTGTCNLWLSIYFFMELSNAIFSCCVQQSYMKELLREGASKKELNFRKAELQYYLGQRMSSSRRSLTRGGTLMWHEDPLHFGTNRWDSMPNEYPRPEKPSISSVREIWGWTYPKNCKIVCILSWAHCTFLWYFCFAYAICFMKRLGH